MIDNRVSPQEWQRQNTRDEIVAHIQRVQHYLDTMQRNLHERSLVHDASKLQQPELDGFVALHEILRTHGYGSPEYVASLASGTVQHHYAANDHHPEHYPNGIRGMSLMALMEMLADWKAASERYQDPALARLRLNLARFGVGEELAAILKNTLDELEWEYSDNG